MCKPCIHFVGFRGDEYISALKVWGKPDFFHMWWDKRAKREVMSGDIVVFPKHASTEVSKYNAPDILENEHED